MSPVDSERERPAAYSAWLEVDRYRGVTLNGHSSYACTVRM